MLLVRKAGTRWFMQAGGKIEPGECAIDALRRELAEEVGVCAGDAPVMLGRFDAVAANEPGHHVEATIFRVRASDPIRCAAEIAEARWATPAEARRLPLAPLTRDHVVPLAEHLLA